jgi:hypothetical protein
MSTQKEERIFRKEQLKEEVNEYIRNHENSVDGSRRDDIAGKPRRCESLDVWLARGRRSLVFERGSPVEPEQRATEANYGGHTSRKMGPTKFTYVLL